MTGRRWWMIVAMFTATGCAPPAQDEARLDGLWAGPIEHRGQAAVFALRLRATAPDSLAIQVSMPPIGVYDIPVGSASFDGTTLRLGNWSATYDPEQRTLTGAVPAALLPVYDVPFTLQRTDAIERPPPVPAPPAAEPLWSHDTGAPVWAGVAAGGGLIYVGNDAGRLQAIRESDASVAWSHQARGPIRATPTLDGTDLFLHTDDGAVSKLDARSGTSRWSATVGDPAERIEPGQPGSRYDSYSSSPLVVRGSVYVGSSDAQRLNALDAATGAVRWSTPTGGSTWATPATTDAAVIVGPVGVADYMVEHHGYFLAVDRAGGDVRWRFTMARPEDANLWGFASSPAVGDRAVYVGGLDGTLYAFPLP